MNEICGFRRIEVRKEAFHFSQYLSRSEPRKNIFFSFFLVMKQPSTCGILCILTATFQKNFVECRENTESETKLGLYVAKV